MIEVSVRKDGVKVSGHAEYAETGNDIICAAVSALAQGLIHSLEALTEDKISYRVETGYMDLKYESLSERGKLLIDSFFIAVSDIQATYGDQYVRIG